MMKLIKCIIVMSLVFIGIVPAEAEENGSYLCVPVEYSDNVNEIEELNVMVLDDNIYVDALQLAQRFGYDLSNNDDENIFLSRQGAVPSQIRFSTKETKVGRTMAMEIDDDQNIHYEFEAPFTSVIDEQGIWIPLEFSILIMNGSVMIYDDHLYIDTPKENFLDTFVQIRKKSSTYSFDWTDDFGYTETDWKVIGESSHLINVFNGLLEFDGDSWLTTFQSFFNNSANYDKKYGQDLAMLICTTSDKELSSMMSDISQSQALFSPDGKLASYLNDKSNIINNDINILYDQCDSLLKEVQERNSQFVTYNRTYQKLQDMLEQKETFDSTGGKILEFQNNLSDATTVFDKLLKIGEVVGYAGEFTNQDAFAVDALYTFLGQVTGDEGLQKNMYDSMRDYEKDLKTNIIEYSGKRYFDEHIDEWIKSGLGLDKILGNQANGLLFVWSIASDMVPFISDGLQAADDFELAMYANVLQGDSFLNLLDQRDWIFSGADQITSENLHILAQDAYIYLKSCYTMREAALGSLKGKSDYVEEKAQPLIDVQNSINSDIAELLSFLKDAPEDNKNGFYGFLPEDNEEYLANYDKSVMKEWVDQYGHSLIDETNFVGEWVLDNTKTREKTGENLNAIFGSMIRDGNHMSIADDHTFSYSVGAYGGDGIWSLKGNDIYYEVKTFTTDEIETGTLRLDDSKQYLIMSIADTTVYWRKNTSSVNDSQGKAAIFTNGVTLEEYLTYGDGHWTHSGVSDGRTFEATFSKDKSFVLIYKDINKDEEIQYHGTFTTSGDELTLTFDTDHGTIRSEYTVIASTQDVIGSPDSQFSLVTINDPMSWEKDLSSNLFFSHNWAS